MKYINKSILILPILLFITGCFDNRNLLRYSGESNANHKELVNKIEKNMKECFEKEQEGIYVGQYVVRENFTNPKYTKLTLYVDNRMFGTIKTLATITVFDKVKEKIYINYRKFPFEVGGIKIGDLKKWYLNGMECTNEKN